jgi:hypothetical protein
MYGDTTVIRGLARRLRDQGADIRAEADSLVGRAEAVPWSGLAADAMRSLARAHAGDLRSCADLHSEAADALDHHAREVDRLEDLIASIERRVHGLLDGALHAAGHAVGHALGGLTHVLSHVAPDPLEHWAQHFVPPPHGSREWLDVHVPGAS